MMERAERMAAEMEVVMAAEMEAVMAAAAKGWQR